MDIKVVEHFSRRHLMSHIILLQRNGKNVDSHANATLHSSFDTDFPHSSILVSYDLHFSYLSVIMYVNGTLHTLHTLHVTRIDVYTHQTCSHLSRSDLIAFGFHFRS